MKLDLQELAEANPVTSEIGEAWALTAEAESARRRARDGGLEPAHDLTSRRSPRIRWPAAVVGAALVLILALPALLFLGDEPPQATTTTIPATTTSIQEHLVPVSEEPFYTALLQCVADRYGTGFGSVMTDNKGQVTVEGQAALDRAAGTGVDFSECFKDRSMRSQTFPLDNGEASILLPADWIRTETRLTPNVGEPWDRISIGTYPLVANRESGDSCGLQALEDLSPSDVFIQILERVDSQPGVEPRPPTFAGRVNGLDKMDEWECLTPEGRSDLKSLRWLNFADEGREFYLLVALGSDTSDQDLHAVERILDSFEVPPEIAPGWTFTEIPFNTREGSGYAIGGGWLFAWSGAPDRSGDMRRDGILVDIDTGQSRPIPDAPIEGRYLPSAVWTGTEFIVFGGHSFTESLVDGAAYDPVTGAWREIAPAPLDPASRPAAVWTGDGMVVWLAGEDSETNDLPPPVTGQLASYDPGSDSWTMLEHPDIRIVDALLRTDESGRLTLVGGPNMRDVGVVGGYGPLYTTTYDSSAESWSEPVIDSISAESARVFASSTGLAVLRDDGEIHVLGETAWGPLAEFGQSCWYDVGAASGGGSSYLKFCGSNYLLDGTEIVPILGAEDFGATSNTFGSAFLATEDGRLVVMGDSDQEELASGIVVFGVYDPAG